MNEIKFTGPEIVKTIPYKLPYKYTNSDLLLSDHMNRLPLAVLLLDDKGNLIVIVKKKNNFFDLSCLHTLYYLINS